MFIKQLQEVYNLVRLLIASYVFLTGYGNTVYCLKCTKYSVLRCAQMLFRINAFTVVLLIFTRNEYMLYYIAPMHTFWFICVYCTFWFRHHENKNLKFLLTKCAVFLGSVVLVYELLPCEYIFFPLRPILVFKGSMYEWCFRSGLDRYATPTGMALALFLYHPELKRYRDTVLNSMVLTGLASVVSVTAMLLYGFKLFPVDKYSYNNIHPYLSVRSPFSYSLRNR